MTDISAGFSWAGVELRHLVALRTVAEERSLAAAARRLGYSQPAISQQLAGLERLVGARLVERRAGGREVRLTDAGKRVLVHGTAILARAQAADADLRALAEGNVGTLVLGTIPSVGARIVPRVLAAFSARWRDVNVELVEDGWDQSLLDRLESGELDLTVALPPLREGPFVERVLLEDDYVLLVASGSSLAGGDRPLPLKHLADEPLLVCSQSRVVETFLHAHGIAARTRYRIDDNETLVGMAAAGLGAALLPRLAVDPARTDIAQVELVAKPPPRLISIAWHRDRELTEAARDLIATAERICAHVASPRRTGVPGGEPQEPADAFSDTGTRIGVPAP